MKIRLFKPDNMSKEEFEAEKRLYSHAPHLLVEVEAMLADLEDFFPDEPLISGGEDEAKETVVAVRKRIALINQAQPAPDRAGKE